MHLPQLDGYDRSPISQSTLDLLCDFALADVTHPLRTVNVDWQEVYEAVCHNGLLGLVYNYLDANPSAANLPAEFRQAVNHTYRLAALRMALLYRAVEYVLKALGGANIDYLVVKGPAVAHAIYSEPRARHFNDLDIIIRERDWGQTHSLLTNMGFDQEENLPQPPPKINSQAVAYETKYWNEELGLKVEVHYDDILNAGLVSRTVEGFWQRAVMLEMQGLQFKSLSLDDQLVHLCTHIHYHGYTKMIWFADLAQLVRNHSDSLDWQRLLRTVEMEEVQVPIYYSLYFLGQLLDVHAPNSVLERLKPDRIRRWFHDWYTPPEQIVSFQPCRRPDFSFYFIPFYKRLLPDLLVMGRRRDKLRYLLRLMVPPGEWLQFYYQIQNPRWLPIHYLLHPVRLFAVYARETALVLAKRSYDLEPI